MRSSLPEVWRHTKLCELINYWQHTTPTAPALVVNDQTLSYQAFAQQIDTCAKQLLAQGVEAGDVVALYARPGLAFAVQLFACARIGAIWLGLNPKYSAAELTYILEHAHPSCLWIEDASLTQADAAVLTLFQQHANAWLFVVSSAPDDWSLAAFSATTCAPLAPIELPCLLTIDANAPALIIYTSGTTGKPKGAVISQAALTKASLIQANILALTAPRVLNNLPINHIGAVGDITTSVIANGGCVIMQPSFDPAEGFRLIERYRVTLWGQIPTMFNLALAHESFPTADLSSLQCILFSGAPASLDLVRQLRTLCPHVVNAYGMSETVGSVTWAIDASDEVLTQSVGTPVSTVELRLADDSGVEVAAGEKGEIQIRSDYHFSHYWHDPKATAATFTADGFLKTGDMGQRRSDGTIALAGRTKERFKSGGYNVYPREIELTLCEHPAVLDCVVVAVPHALYHEVGFAFIVTHNDVAVATLQAHCKQHLANYKVPKQFEILSQFPQLANGKIDRKQLAERAAQLFRSKLVM